MTYDILHCHDPHFTSDGYYMLTNGYDYEVRGIAMAQVQSYNQGWSILEGDVCSLSYREITTI